MRVLVVNGSPKGKNSITYQTIRFLQKKFPNDEFKVLHVGAQIGLYARDMSDACEAVKGADMLLFAYPVYTFLAPSQLHQFIRLLKEQDIDLSGKYVTQITTSKHFYDMTAHSYVEENCRDMGMNVLRGFSADMDDLLTKKGQLQVITYWNYVNHIIQQEMAETIGYDEGKGNIPVKEKDAKYRVVVVTDCARENERLRQMIMDFRKAFPYESHVINLQEHEIKGGCLGCFHCAIDGTCVYQDGFSDLLRNKIQRADSIVYAFSIKDHSMGELFKRYDDRQFCNGHRSVTMGKPTAYLIDGEFSRESNLQLVLEGRSQIGGNFLASIATNEGVGADSTKTCADKLAYALEHRIQVNENFYGVGGKKIFRDLVYEMQGMMQADHRFYKQHRLYDFPQKKIGRILFMKAVGATLRMPSEKNPIQAKMSEGMLMPYEQIINGK